MNKTTNINDWTHTTVYNQIKMQIARECGELEVFSKTKFIKNPRFSHFDCANILYTLEHMYGITLPESDYDNYDTVGHLTLYIINKLKERTKQ